MRYQPRASQMIRVYKGKEVPKRQPLRRPCNRCEKKFQPTGRTNYYCRPCITAIRRERKAERLKEKNSSLMIINPLENMTAKERRQIKKDVKRTMGTLKTLKVKKANYERQTII